MSGSSALCLYFYLLNRVEKEKNALQSEGDDLAVSLETLQKQKVSIFIGYPSLETGFLIAKHSLTFSSLFFSEPIRQTKPCPRGTAE